MRIGSVASCWRFPVKSLQGLEVDRIDVDPDGVRGDRSRALLDAATGKVLSAKRLGGLLAASADDRSIRLPDGTRCTYEADDLGRLLSDWLGREVTLETAAGSRERSYEMTFDPPDDDAEYFEIPIPDGTFLDLAPLHLLSTATLDGCRDARPDLDWDVRRFRPNVVLETDGGPFVEDGWTGRRLRLGDTCVVQVDQPTVRCAMPLRAQPSGSGSPALARCGGIFSALNELHVAAPNHLGAYGSVVVAGSVAVGDPVELVDD